MKSTFSSDEDQDPLAFTFVVFICVTVFSFIVYAISGFKVSDFQNFFSIENLKYIAIMMSAYATAATLYYKGLKNLPLSETSIYYSSTGLWFL